MGPGCLISKNEIPFSDKMAWQAGVPLQRAPTSSLGRVQGPRPRWHPSQPHTSQTSKPIFLKVSKSRSRLLPPPTTMKITSSLWRIQWSPLPATRFNLSLFIVLPTLLSYSHQCLSPSAQRTEDTAPRVTVIPVCVCRHAWARTTSHTGLHLQYPAQGPGTLGRQSPKRG